MKTQTFIRFLFVSKGAEFHDTIFTEVTDEKKL